MPAPSPTEGGRSTPRTVPIPTPRTRPSRARSRIGSAMPLSGTRGRSVRTGGAWRSRRTSPTPTRTSCCPGVTIEVDIQDDAVRPVAHARRRAGPDRLRCPPLRRQHRHRQQPRRPSTRSTRSASRTSTCSPATRCGARRSRTTRGRPGCSRRTTTRSQGYADYIAANFPDATVGAVLRQQRVRQRVHGRVPRRRRRGRARASVAEQTIEAATTLRRWPRCRRSPTRRRT